MSLDDRDWYREEMKARQRAEASAVTKGLKAVTPGSSRRAFGWSVSGVLAIIAFALVVVIARDMKDRGVPFTLQGLRWWVSLWT